MFVLFAPVAILGAVVAYSAPVSACSVAGDLWRVTAIDGDHPDCFEVRRTEPDRSPVLLVENTCEQLVTLDLASCQRKDCIASCDGVDCETVSWNFETLEGRSFGTSDLGIQNEPIAEGETITAEFDWSRGSNSGSLTIDARLVSAANGCEGSPGCAGCLAVNRATGTGHAVVLVLLLTMLGGFRLRPLG